MSRALAGDAARSWSLRRRLLGSVVGSTVLLWIVSLAVVVGIAWGETSDVFDDALEEGARLALALGPGGTATGTSIAPGLGRQAQRLKLDLQFVAADGRVLRRAGRAPERAFVQGFDTRDDDGDFHDVRVDGRRWRVFVLPGDGALAGLSVQVGQRYDERLELLEDMAEDLAWPALVLLLLLGAVCWWLIRRLLGPVEQTAARLAMASPADLRPVPETGLPTELQPVVRSLNQVLARLAEALEAERRFTADAAHELRTPLAALSSRLQLMQRQAAQSEVPATDLSAPPAGAASGIASARSLGALRADVDRCTALVENLLALARLDPERSDTLARTTVETGPLVARAVELCLPAARTKRISIDVDVQVPSMQANADLLAGALRNLIDNAVRYSPPGSRVLVTARRQGGVLSLGVLDDGPGVADADRARLGERFFRVPGSGVAGSGLGLSLVTRIARLHGGQLRIGAGLEGRGLGVTIEWPEGA